MRPPYRERLKEMSLPIGMHLATIGTINYARLPGGSLIMHKADGTEYPVIEITLRIGDEKIVQHFPTTPASQWIWDGLSRALGIDNEKPITAAEAKGKPVYVMVAGKAEIEGNGKLRRNSDGSVYFEKQVRMKFWPFIEGAFAPAISGDPARNGGIPSGEFLLNEGMDINEIFAYEKAMLSRPLTPAECNKLNYGTPGKYPVVNGVPQINEAEQRWLDKENGKRTGELPLTVRPIGDEF